jgi:anti-sigma regulatory factor (Ser/Thr protein kinase)
VTTTLQKSLNNDVGDLIALAPEVENFLAQHGVSSDARVRILTALEEIILNLIKHSATRQIDVRLDIEAERVVVLIEDDSAPFDPRSAPEFDRDRSLDERRAGGMGLQMVRSLVNELEYEHLAGRNRLRLAVTR